MAHPHPEIPIVPPPPRDSGLELICGFPGEHHVGKTKNIQAKQVYCLRAKRPDVTYNQLQIWQVAV